MVATWTLCDNIDNMCQVIAVVKKYEADTKMLQMDKHTEFPMFQADELFPSPRSLNLVSIKANYYLRNEVLCSVLPMYSVS